jgi:uncharacterized RDD family membrane protein YckC
MSDDYYELLGVDEGAPTADIRGAYREKKAALDAKGDKTEIARINKAWNVLSDPYQRGRYDQQRADTTDTGEGDDGPLEAVGAGAVTSAGSTSPTKASANGSGDQPPPRRRLFEPRPRGDRPVPQPTIEIPAGRSLAQQRPRIVAMVIDVAIMIAILLVIQVGVGDRLEKRWYPEQHARLTAIAKAPSDVSKADVDAAKAKADDLSAQAEEVVSEQGANSAAAKAATQDAADAQNRYQSLRDGKSRLDAANDNAKNLDKKADDLEKSDGKSSATAKAARARADAADTYYTDLRDQASKLQRHMVPASIVVLEVIMILCLAYLVIPSGLTGQTLGKRLQKIRVLRVDGSPLGWAGAFTRYGSLILATNLLLLIPGLGQLLLIGLFFIVLGWMRNPNKQALQDRLARTIVVDA